MKTRSELVKKLATILNEVSRENASNTPDFILAEHMVQSLEAFESGTRSRENWYGRKVKDIHGDVNNG